MKKGLKGILLRKKSKTGGGGGGGEQSAESSSSDMQMNKKDGSSSSEMQPSSSNPSAIMKEVSPPAVHLTEKPPDKTVPQDAAPSPAAAVATQEATGSSAQAVSSPTSNSKRQLTWDTAKQQPEYTRDFSSSSFSSLMISDSELEDPILAKSYDAIPVIEQIKLPRGGISMETQAVGMLQFGIPPETIKDSMKLGLPVPMVYIVPVERFCREMGPALGVNLAEFEFPAYFNFFVNKKQCTLIVDSDEAERNIRRVFSETLLGPAQFRREENPITYEEEDFAPDFPRDAIPNFQKELKYFRIMPDGKELALETLLKFCHFATPRTDGSKIHERLGVPPPLSRSGSFSTLLGSDELAVEMEDDVETCEGVELPKDLEGIEEQEEHTKWTYSQARWNGDVATVYPANASQEDIEARNVKRVEIFKMPGGTEYILHDVDENNHIVGKARFSGHVKVSDTMAVDGFGGLSIIDDGKKEEEKDGYHSDDNLSAAGSEELEGGAIPKSLSPPTFHPPSFGVTVLGNSHGFDKSGSVSGYVLWINGRGVMIDPPPYSSATLEREGIRPRTIVGIILTHCHADHDAGAFQKVLTGSQVAVITTPTIYKSFIRKYAALSELSPALLRHSHRHRPAIIGRPLRFQGATFHFTYSLHTIPCIGFRVDWRGRSMVFTGDHFNDPPAVKKLEEKGVLSKARADDLRNLPLQEADLLLHEAGAPPIHTPLDVLLKLPQRVKKRMYVVHTSNLPPDCELRVAPTGTAGTIRLDQLDKGLPSSEERSTAFKQMKRNSEESASISLDDDAFSSSWGSSRDEYGSLTGESDMESDNLSPVDPRLMATSIADLQLSHSPNAPTGTRNMMASMMLRSGPQQQQLPPLVSLRPASSTDAWFILNLLSAVPFLSSLSYASTMEVLESARVDAFCQDDVVVPRGRREDVLCVVWEGTCVERHRDLSRPGHRRHSTQLLPVQERGSGTSASVWYAGDWTGPISLQPDRHLSGQSESSSTHDIVAMSSEGVKAITIEFSDLHGILDSGSPLYRKYLERKAQQQRVAAETPESNVAESNATDLLLIEAQKNLNVLELLGCNSALRKLTAVQKRHLESLAEGPVSFQPGERLWRAGSPVDSAYIIISGTASFLPKRRNAGSAGVPPAKRGSGEASSESRGRNIPVGESMRHDAMTAVRELRESGKMLSEDSVEDDDVKNAVSLDSVFSRPAEKSSGGSSSNMAESDYDRLSRGLKQRANFIQKTRSGSGNWTESDSEDENRDTIADLEFQLAVHESDESPNATLHADQDRRASLLRRRSSRARFANKVLGRLYSRRAFTSGFVFSRGHFLGDVSKMVAGLLSSKTDSDLSYDPNDIPKYGFGDAGENKHHGMYNFAHSDSFIAEEGQPELTLHTSTLTAGRDGCVVLVFTRANLIPFLDEHPGLLMSLLGTQVVV